VTSAQARHFSIHVIVPPGALLLDIAGPAEVLRRANVEQSAVRFDVRYHAPVSTMMTSAGLTLAELLPLPETLEENAVIVVSGDARSFMLPDRDQGPDADMEAGKAAIVEWLGRQVRPDRLLICICSGALLAARAGLLDGYACTTHHTDCAELARLAPLARVMENCLYIEDRARLTSAGVTTGVDLMLHLVSRLIDPLCALRIARHLVVYLRRSGSEPQTSPWLVRRNHLHRVVHRAQDAIAAQPEENWTLESLANITGTSARHLSRLFNEHVGTSVPNYLGQMRVTLASEFLRRTSMDLESVAARVGFTSTRQFRRVWGQYFPYPPSYVRRQPNVRQSLQSKGASRFADDHAASTLKE
jgi:transcriptional regulator GlxA family with amidase domain